MVVIGKLSDGSDNSALLVAFIALIGVLLSVVLTYILNKRMMSDESIKNKKRTYYSDFLALFMARTTKGKVGEDNLVNAYEMMKLWASENVLISVADALKFISNQSDEILKLNEDLEKKRISGDEYNKEFTKRVNSKYYKIIAFMRQDLGVNTKFKIDDKNICIIN